MREPEPPRPPDGSDPTAPLDVPGSAAPLFSPAAVPPTEAGASASAEATPPAPEAAAQPYELQTARRVVSSGLALSLTSNADLRRGSIYIGLLVLGSFGPALVAFLMTIGRLGDGALDALGTLLFAPQQMAADQPELGGILLVLMLVAIGGLTLFAAISVDAQAMALAILGGRASGKPLRLWESITRARQVFWRLASAGFLVAIFSLIAQSLILAALAGFSRSDTTLSLVTALIATLLISPFAYVSAGIVLGDVGAIESLSRSIRLFRARPWLAIVVVLFTLITEAIQLFALSAGLDLVIRAGELLHVSLTESAVAFLVAIALVLAAVMAFGSLSFTIAAIVSAPQVTSFLGLTFFSGGLDRARSETARAPRGFRWISRPMTALMLLMAVVVAVEIPAINAIQPAPVSAMLGFVRGEILAQPELWDAFGSPASIDDATGDLDGAAGRASPEPGVSPVADAFDIELVEYAYLPTVPRWLLDDVFACDGAAVACAAGAGNRSSFDDGALLFLQRTTAPFDAGPAGFAAAVLLTVDGDAIAPRGTGRPYAAASRVFVTRFGEEPALESLRYGGGAFSPSQSAARSMWRGSDLYTLIPFAGSSYLPSGWDAVTLVRSGSDDVLRDGVRSLWGERLRNWDARGEIYLEPY